MRFPDTFIYSGIFFGSALFGQIQPQSIKITTTAVGASAISVNTIIAKTYNFNYAVKDLAFDTLTNQVFFSARQSGESGGSQYLSKGYFGAIRCKGDSVKWINESSLFHLDVTGSALLLSNDVKTVKYNKFHGYDELRFDSKVILTAPYYNKGFIYSRTEPDVLNCVNLSVGIPSWTATIPRGEDWVDTRFLNDSIVYIAAAGLHAVNVRRGLLWSYPLVTSAKSNRPLVYSLAKYLKVQKISSVIKTTTEENLVTQLASNIVHDGQNVYFASKEKLIAVSHAGKLAWKLDLKGYPVSKMLIFKTDSSLILANFGLATHSNNFVTWGKPFILAIDPATGRIINQFDLSNIENLADFVKTDRSIIFAGKNAILEAKPGDDNLNTVIDLNEGKYGRFSEFVDGFEYYLQKEGYYVALNFINDNLVYFKTDNNKVYGIDGKELVYEYHFTELFRFDKKFEDKTLLVNEQKTLITSRNFELLFTLNLTGRSIIAGSKMYFIDNSRIHMIHMPGLK